MTTLRHKYFKVLLLLVINFVQNINSRTPCYESDLDLYQRNKALDKQFQIKLDDDDVKYYIPGDKYISEYYFYFK